jgi:Kdo2-lipid IVA lauroyltransferase/acyltransferase
MMPVQSPHAIQQHTKMIKKAIQHILAPSLIKLLALLPLGAARAIGIFIGNCIWLARGRTYQKTLLNVRKCFPELDKNQTRRFVRESIIETAKTAIEAGAIWKNSWEWLCTHIIDIEGDDILRAELAKGKGLVVLAPHLGNWEVVAPYLASVAALTAMYQPLASPALDKLVFSGRSKLNINMAPTNRKGVSMLLKALQQGNIVGILPDQIPEKGAGAETVKFFGHPALTMSLVHSLINRTQSRVVSVFAMRVPKGFKIIVLAAAPEIYSEEAHESVRGMNLSIETCVRMAPTQYQWEYNRFRGLLHKACE